ncbi:PAS domain-containing sensor histidine kinase [Nocardioides sp.]|uniref:sensor histidine kinase n=1 Tax=Nocardioides sp. TaxID=35761 RepID=UPI002B278E66|nr:PAS domain-containing sensor histidine kinase [Nocardioides sp.]
MTLRGAGGIAGAATVALGLTVILGWVLDLSMLTSVIPGQVSMKVNAAAALVALGLSAVLLARPGRRRPSSTVLLLAGAVVLLGLATLLEYATGLDLGFDNPFGLDRPGAVGTSRPGRMSPVTALCLSGLGAALIATLGDRARWAQTLAAGTLALSVIAIVGYLFSLEPLYRVDVYTSMAVPTAASLSLLSLAVLCLRSEQGFMHLVTSQSVGGVFLRRLLPWTLLLPVGAGAILVTGLERGLYDDRSALALLVTFGTVVGVAGVWFQCRELGKVDLRRADAVDMQERLQQSLAARDRLAAQLIDSEKHARDVVENSADAYIALSPDGRVEDWNGAATVLFGWTRDEAVGHTLDNLIIPPALADAHRRGLRRAAVTGEGPLLGRPIEVDALHRDGRHLFVELTIWAVEIEDAWGFHAFLRDVTARRTADSELHRMNDDLRQFAGVVAHDLRTPLTTITGYAELLRESNEEGGAHHPLSQDWIRRIEDASHRGTHLIADLLALTQIGLGELITEPVDLRELVTAVVREQRSLGHADATVDIGPLPTVAGDPGLLSQLFSNLIGNALKYAGDGGPNPPVVQVGVEPSPTPGRVIIHVSDDGPGIASGEERQVFDMFQRGSAVGSIEGTGIGLAIGRQVVERHHGRIWVDRSDLGGAAFYVELPAAPVPW